MVMEILMIQFMHMQNQLDMLPIIRIVMTAMPIFIPHHDHHATVYHCIPIHQTEILLSYHSNVIGKISLIIFDARGKLVFTSSDVVDTKGSLVKKLNLFNFQSGAYYLSIYNSEEESHASFIILK